MTTLDPVRPGSALTDPNLRTAWEERVRRLEAAAASGGRTKRWRLQDALDIWSILAAYPWQRINYRYGRWESEGTLWKYLISLTIWRSYHWETDYRSFQLLDPNTGQRLGEFYAGRRDLLTKPGGTLDFAGDPASIGVYRPVGGGLDTITLGHCWFLGRTRMGIDQLRAGADRLPPARKVDLDIYDRVRVWFIDEPDKPRRKAPDSTEARLYRP